jgi:hypothetical protein
MTDLEEEVRQEVEDLTDSIFDDRSTINNAISGISRTENKSGYKWENVNRESKQEALLILEKWYSGAFPLVSEYRPDRKEEFVQRFEILMDSIEVNSQFILENEPYSDENIRKIANDSVNFLVRVLKSVPNRIRSEQLRAKENVSSQVVSEELEKAKELFDEGHIRAAGVIGGVALERHLTTLCETSEQDLEFGYMDGITSLATTLSDADEIEDDDQRLLEYIGGIRNKCGHASDEEPEKREVERMLNQTDEFIR